MNSKKDEAIKPPGKRGLIRRALDRCFGYESMSGNGACPVYLERWRICVKMSFGVYLHHFLGDDWALDPHDHPRRFISLGLWGWYHEDLFTGDGTLIRTDTYKAPWLRSFPAEHLHRVRAVECGNCWTLVIVLKKSREWGFVQDGAWVAFRKYVFGGKSRKSC